MSEIDWATATPIMEDEQGIERIVPDIDWSSAKPVGAIREASFKFLDNSGTLMRTAKDLFYGTERGISGLASGAEFLGRDIVAETKSETIPLVPFPGLKSINWLRVPKGESSKVGLAIDDFFVRFGSTLAGVSKKVKDYFNEQAEKGIETPNPAIMMGWKHPFKKTVSLAAQNLPMLGIAAGVTVATKSPVAGAATFFPAAAGDMYEDAIKNGVDPLKAADLAYTTGAMQTVLENIPLRGWMKGGHMLKRVFRVALQEGLIEEGSQQVFDNSLRIIGWQESRPVWDRLTDGIAESILAGAVSGGVLGAFEAPHIDDIRYDLHNEVITEGLKQGLNEEQISQTIDQVNKEIDRIIGIEEEKSPVPIAVRLKDGTVITDPDATLHSDIIASKDIDPDNVQDVGIMDNEGTYQAMKFPDEKGGAPLESLPEVPKEVLDKVRQLIEEPQPVALPEESDLTEEDWLENEGKEYGQLEQEALSFKKEKQTLEIKARLEEINKRQAGLQDQFIARKNKDLADEAAKIMEEKGLRPIAKEDFNQPNKPLPIEKIEVDEELLSKINQLQVILEKQIIISSGYRTKEYNEDLKKRGYKPAENSTHLTGRAADIKITGTGLTHDEVIKAAQELGLAVEDIEQTPHHVHVELPTPGSETPLMKAKKLVKAKRIKNILGVLPEDVEKIKAMRRKIEEAGKRARTEAGELVGIASTFPDYFRDKGYTKKATLAIIDKVIAGQPVTNKQQAIFEDLINGYKTALQKEAENLEKEATDEHFREELKKQGFGESEIEEIIRLAGEEANDKIAAEGIGVSGSKLFKTSAEAEVFIVGVEDKGGQAEIARVSPEEVEVSYILPETQPSVFPSVSPEEEKASVLGKLGAKPKTVPSATATGKMEWEKTEAWQVNQGRDITGIFEREIGPELQVSKRLKKWLGVYYPMLGPNGLIRVRSIADEKTLFHETGHFLDDVLGDYQISRKKAVRDELKAVSQQMRPFDPAEASKSYKSYRHSKAELFADYVAAYTLDPEICRRFAPNFTAEIESTIGQDKEWQYVIAKLREFEEAMKPLKEYVSALRKIPEIQPWLEEWAENGNLLQQLWRNKVGDKVWDVYSRAIESLGKKAGLKVFFEKGGLNDTVFEILRQRRKLIHGQQERLKEELIGPISVLNKEEQQKIAESLQRFGETMQDTDLAGLTEEARKELALWGNEARKLGLLNDEIFWNNVGQYFPFFYETKEFEKNKRNFGYFPSKAIRARFESLKHKMTDEEFGRKVLEAQYGTWPSAKEKIAQYTKEELIELGRNAREELGLIKTAAYPLQKRVFGMIEMVYTVKAFNAIATIPGIIGHKGVEGFDKMPAGKKYGTLAEQYVPVELVKEVSNWNVMRDELTELWRNANTVWKMFKVPYSPAAVSRNLVTNAVMAWFGDVPIYKPSVAAKGIRSFINQDEAYKILRDNGLYHNTYSEQELKELAFQLDQDPANPYKQVLAWANKIGEVIQSPARLYGSIEDASKTVIARYVLDNGGSPAEAVKFADKLLFDYSQVSKTVGYARQSFWPFITWSAKILPRLVEFAIRKPEKYLLLFATIGIWNAISRATLGLDRDDEEKLKPDYIRGKSVLLLPGRDTNGDLNWVDMTYFLPWGSWLPVDRGDLSAPSVFNIGGPLVILYNAYVLNHDPFYGEIAPDYLSEDKQTIEKGKYVAKNLLPQILATTPGKLINSTKPDKHGRRKEIGKVLSGEFLGVKFVQDTSAYRGKIIKATQQDFYRGRAKLRDQLRSGEISREEYNRQVQKLQQKLRKEKERH